MNGGDWEWLFSVSTSRAELETIIDERIRVVLLDLCAQLLDDADLSDAQRAQAWTKGAALIRAQTRATLEAGWQRLQLDAAAPGSVQ